MAAGSVDGGSRRRLVSAGAVAGDNGGGWWQKPPQNRAKQGKQTNRGEAEHGGDDWTPASSAATSGGLSGWRAMADRRRQWQREAGEGEKKQTARKGGSHG